MKIAFTLCSNNYLGAAKVLIQSLKAYHADFKLFIGLVDELDESVDYSIFGCTVLTADKIALPEHIKELSRKFNIVELNTAVKPFYFKHFFFKEGAQQVVYLDPDIQVFGRMHEVLNGLQSSMLTLTPHMLSPVDDQFGPNDYHILRTGIFNLGFIGLSNHRQLAFFLDWWGDRCMKYGFRKDEAGMFYDQIWINYVPAFFDSYYIIKHPGYNAANWNLHERWFSVDNFERWRVNNIYELVFFHFSHFNILSPQKMSTYNSRYNFDNREDVAPLFRAYYDKVVANGGIEYKRIVPLYKQFFEKAEKERLKKYYTFKRKLINKMTGFMHRIIPE